MCYLSNLAVSPGAQRLGIGRQLLLRGEDLARQWGCRRCAGGATARCRPVCNVRLASHMRAQA